MPAAKKTRSASAKLNGHAPTPVTTTEERTFLLTPNNILDLTNTNPDYLTQLLQGSVLDQEHEFVTLHNRRRVITDSLRERMYMRNGTARLIVDDPAADTWREGFKVEDEGTQDVLRRVFPRVYPALKAADIWNRLYGPGFIVMGFNDGRALSTPVGSATEVLWAHAFSKRHLQSTIFDKDRTSPTYGQPRQYVMRASRPGGSPSGQNVVVHADRILTLIERPHVHPTLGGSILDPAWNDLEDRASIGWANSESYYSGASPKFILKTQRPLTAAQESQVDTQFSETRSNVRDVLKILSSMELIPLTKGSDVAKPLEHLIVNSTLLSDATGLPFSRFFKYHLTSGEGLDWASREWYEFISTRQRTFGTVVARDLLSALSRAGIVDAEQVLSPISWNPPRVMTREDIAKILRNEAIAWASMGQTGYVPKEVRGSVEKAPSDLIVPKAPDGPTGEKSMEPERKQQKSTKNLSRANEAELEGEDDG